MRNFIKEYWKMSLGLLILIAAIIPGGVLFFMDVVFSGVGNGTDDGWLGFWGGYLGSIIGIAGTITFTIYYSDKQLEINREAQVQAYMKQYQIIALRDYEVSMLDTHDKFVEASLEFGNRSNQGEIMHGLNVAFESLNDKCSNYQLLTSTAEAAPIAKIQNDLAKKYSDLWFSGTIAMGDVYTKTVDSEGNEILKNRTAQAVEDEMKKFSDFSMDLLKSTNEVKAFFDNTFQSGNKH